ncbi:hypothetical protein JCGZ_16382 [Jatropha curcas]|uniref:F-box domain-containing protein n=1 Tax=Jatropha curcas TaxID=180498 RepID=A0A067LJS6_JATCU|nr:hypothetical protein JCGZ_16382 [Jatropha curcas]
MKLRLRSLQSKETVKLEVPNECTLQQLRETLSLALSFPCSSSFHFSLNRKDELVSSSLQDSLISLGITAGDLIYFSLSPDEFLPSHQTLGQGQAQAQNQQGNLQESDASDLTGKQETLIQAVNVNFHEPISKECETPNQEPEVLGLNCPNEETPNQSIPVKDAKSVGGATTSETENLIQDLSMQQQSNFGGEASNTYIEETMESPDGMDIDTESSNANGKRIFEPYFLKSVLREELGENVTDNKLLFVAIHAIFLEFGFVGIDSVSGLRVDLFHFLEEQSSMSFTTSVNYTVPELLANDNVTESVVLSFQTLGGFVNVYGSLTQGQSLVHKLCLNKYRFVPSISLIWVNSLKSDNLNESYDSIIMANPETEIFNLWKLGRDELAYPLLIDLCEKTGLDLPPCLMRLPADLKLKILESLPGVGSARMACMWKEMSYLASNNDLWKQKYAEEFGTKPEMQGLINWKAKFVSSWERRRRRKRSFRPKALPFQVIRHDPNPLIIPLAMIGGDYDRLPSFGVPSPLTLPGQARAFPVRRNFSPNCNLGGFDV